MINFSEFADEYLRSFSIKKISAYDQEEEEEARKEKEERKKFQEQIKKGKLDAHEMGTLESREEAEIALTKVLSPSRAMRKDLAREKEPVLDPYSWQDLNLIRGNAKTPEKSTLNLIKKTETTVGGCVMASQLVNPHSSLQEIEKKQKAVTFLSQKREVTEKIDRHVKGIKQEETLRLSFWKKDSPLRHEQYQKTLNGFYFKRFGLGNFNKSTWGLQLAKFRKDFCLHWGLVIWLIGAALLLFIRSMFSYQVRYMFFYAPDQFGGVARGTTQANTIWERYFWSDNISLFIPGLFFFSPLSFGSWDSLAEGDEISPFNYLRGLFSAARQGEEGYMFVILMAGAMLMYSLMGIFFAFSAYKKFRRNRSTLNFLAAHLAPFQDLVLHGEKILHLVDQHTALREGVNLSGTRRILRDPDLKSLIDNLKGLNLRSRWYFFSNTGRLLATYKMLEEDKNKLADLQYEMGKVDTLLAVHKLLRESQAYDANTHFIIGKIKEAENNLPTLKMKGMWHFGIDAKHVVKNDVALDSRQGARTLVITGPNAGGKSTYILGTAMGPVLMQAFGVAPAAFCEQSVFYKIITYVNPTQNLAAGLSLGEAGMEVLRTHKQVLSSIRKPILGIIDEILNGTDPKVAADLSYKILRDRNANYPQCVTLLTTHYQNLPDLAKEDKRVVNKKVVVKIPGSNGRKFDYTYRIEDGISDQNIVEDMLADKGVL